MASKSHVDNTVNERRLRPIYGMYIPANDNRISNPHRAVPPDRSTRDSPTGGEVI